MRILLFLTLLITNINCNSQNPIALRDVVFSIPNGFHQSKEKVKLDYQKFYEAGKIYSDTSHVDHFPKIYYQYYENPYLPYANSKTVLKDLIDAADYGLKQDTLIINGTKNYSIVSYDSGDSFIYEGKSIGLNGYINIQLFCESANSENYNMIDAVMKSVTHHDEFVSDADRHMKNSGESSKWAIVGLFLSGIIYFVSKQINKNKPVV